MSADSYTHVRTRVRKSPAWVAMLTRFPLIAHTGLCWGCFFLSCFLCRFFLALGRVQDGSGAQHGLNLGSFWSHDGHLLDHFWVLLCALHLRCSWRRFLFDFSSIFDAPEEQKHYKNKGFFNIFAFLVCSLLRPMRDRFGSILVSKIVPRSPPRGLFKAVRNHVRTQNTDNMPLFYLSHSSMTQF